MKKRLLVLPILAGLALCGCDLFKKKEADREWDILPEFASGTEAEKTAILKAINDLSPCVNKNGNDIFPDVNPTFNEDDGNYIKVTTKQKVGDLTVDFEWNIDETQPTFETKANSDDSHVVINLKYPGYGNPDTQFKWSMSKATCGSAATSKTNCDYTAILKGETHPHYNVKIADLNKVTDHKFDVVDYTKASPYFKTVEGDPNPDYYYVKVKGKIVFYADDGDWALLADGNQFIELFSGSARNLKPSEYPAFNNGWVEVSGNMDQYKGNIQISHISTIKACSSEGLAEPVLTGTNIDSAFITGTLQESASKHYMAIDGFSNSIGKVTGTIVEDSIKDGDDKATNVTKISSKGRFTFAVDVGGQQITVAYDYHTDMDGSKGLFDALKAKLLAGGSIELKGSMRYNGADTDPFKTDASGVWNVVPFAAADVK